MTDGTMLRIEALQRRDRRRPRLGPGQGRGGHRAGRAERGAGPARAGDGEPRRHRRQTIAGAISTGTHGTGAKLRNISAQVEGLELVLADGSVRELERRHPPGAAAGGAGRGRGAGGDLGGDPALRSRLHPRPRRHARARASRCSTPSRRAPTPTTTSSSSPSPTPTAPWCWSATAPRRPPRPRGRAAAYLNDVVLENWALEALSATGKRFPRAIPSLSRLAGPARLRQPHGRPQRPRLRQRPPRPLHRDGVRRPARARAGGGAAGDRVGALQPLPGLLPDRDAGRRRRRRPAQPLARARHRLHRRAPVPRHGVAALLRGGRGDHGLLRRPPPLGQAPLPDRRHPGPALPGWAEFQAARDELDPGRIFTNEYAERVWARRRPRPPTRNLGRRPGRSGRRRRSPRLRPGGGR